MQFSSILLLAGLSAAVPLASTVEPTTSSSSMSTAPTSSPTAIVGSPIERTENFTMTVTSAANKTLDGLTVVIPPTTGTSIGLQLADKPPKPALGSVVGTGDEFASNNATLELSRGGDAPAYEGIISGTDLSPFAAQTAQSLNRDAGGFGVDTASKILYHLKPGSGDFFACQTYGSALPSLRWGPSASNVKDCDQVVIHVQYS